MVDGPTSQPGWTASTALESDKAGWPNGPTLAAASVVLGSGSASQSGFELGLPPGEAGRFALQVGKKK